MPRHQASLWAKYKFFDKLTAGVGVRYMGTTFGDNQNTFTVPAYTLYDMMLAYDFMPNLNLQLNAQNLTNKNMSQAVPIIFPVSMEKIAI